MHEKKLDQSEKQGGLMSNHWKIYHSLRTIKLKLMEKYLGDKVIFKENTEQIIKKRHTPAMLDREEPVGIYHEVRKNSFQLALNKTFV